MQEKSTVIPIGTPSAAPALGEKVLEIRNLTHTYGNGVKALASLPSLDELRAKIVGLIQAPATKIAQLVNAPAAKVARVVQAYAAKGETA